MNLLLYLHKILLQLVLLLQAPLQHFEPSPPDVVEQKFLVHGNQFFWKGTDFTNKLELHNGV